MLPSVLVGAGKLCLYSAKAEGRKAFILLWLYRYEQSHSTSTAELISNVCAAHPRTLWVLPLVMVASTGLYLLVLVCLPRTNVRSRVQWPASSSAPPHATTTHRHKSAKYFQDSSLALIPFLVCFAFLCFVGVGSLNIAYVSCSTSKNLHQELDNAWFCTNICEGKKKSCLDRVIIKGINDKWLQK